MTEELHPRLVPIPLGMVKAFLIIGKRPLLVDCGMRNHLPRILSALAKQQIKPQNLSLIVITHAHPDHIGGLAEMRDLSGAPVAVHEDDAQALREGTRPIPGFWDRLFRRGPVQEGPGVAPDVLVGDELDLAPYGVEGRVLSMPGHTPGELAILLPGGRALVGDMFLGGFVGRGRPRRHFLASDAAQMEASVQRLLELDLTEIHPAHGGPFSIEDVRQAFA